jgi:hypothetical protein
MPVPLLIAALAAGIFSAPGQAGAADAFRRLTEPQIRSRVIGNVVTDESHWSDRFEANGTLSAMELGKKKPGNWKLRANEMCVTRMAKKAVEECFEIWQSGDQIDYRRDGVVLTSGVLRKE